MYKKIIVVLLILSLSLTVLSCDKEVVQDESDLTMYVNSGQDYFERLRDGIYEETGVMVKFVYNNTIDTSNLLNQQISHYDLPADIIITSAKTDSEYQKNAFLDLASYTNIPDLFKISKQQEMEVNGSIYQIPFAARLIGIEYNKTMLEELNLSLPTSYNDLLEIKKAVEDAGYTFAVSGGVATGHGFNYLMHLMGAEYLSTPSGMEWLNDFLNGLANVAEFEDEASYFKEYTESGLYGRLHAEDWNAYKEFSRERAFLYYNILNDCYSYDGLRYNHDGTIYGATYNSDGTIYSLEDPNGELVLYNDEYVLYDENNTSLKDLTRYTIPGSVILHDTYASMPYISKSGSSNSFTSYDCMYFALDKELGEDYESEKLSKAIAVLKYMASEEAAEIFTDIYKDGYVAINDFEIDETRLYYDSKETVEKGYLMEWYYNYFDSDTIASVGQAANDYIANNGNSSFENVMDTLEQCNKNNLNKESEASMHVEESLSYEETAYVMANCAVISLNDTINELGLSEKATIGIVSYTDDLEDLPVFTQLPLIQGRIYSGDFTYSLVSTTLNTKANNIIGLYLSGKEINELINNSFNTEENYNIDLTFPYMLINLDESEILEDNNYLVAISRNIINNSDYETYLNEGKVLTVNDEVITSHIVDGVKKLVTKVDELEPNTIYLN